MNSPNQATAHETQTPAVVYFYSAAALRSRGALWTIFAPAFSAVSDTDFGAEKVASQPARCSTALVVLPSAFLYSIAVRCLTSCSSVRDFCRPRDGRTQGAIPPPTNRDGRQADLATRRARYHPACNNFASQT